MNATSYKLNELIKLSAAICLLAEKGLIDILDPQFQAVLDELDSVYKSRYVCL